MTPHKCPVCDGTGRTSRPPAVVGDSWSSDNAQFITCHACNGKGVVWEQEQRIVAVDRVPMPFALPGPYPPCKRCGSTYCNEADDLPLPDWA